MQGRRVAFNIKFAYGLGQAGEGMFSIGLSFFLLFYYSQILGLSPGLAGSAIGIAVMIDAVSDIVAGSVSDHWQSKIGRRHPFMYASFLPLSFSFILLFFPLVESEMGLFIWLTVFTNAARTMMSLYHVPHIALGAEITTNIDDRSALVAYRQFFSQIGSLIALVLFFLIFSPMLGEGGRFNTDAYKPWALCIASLMAITIFWSAWGTRSVIPYLPQIAKARTIPLVAVFIRLLKDLREVSRNRNFRFLFAGILIVYIMVGVTWTLDLYIISYFWELDDAFVLPVVIAFAIGNATGTFLSVKLFSVFGKKACLITGALAYAFFQTFPVAMRLLGWFPENSDLVVVNSNTVPLVMLLLVIIKLLQGLVTAQAQVAFGSMIADVCDEHEHLTDRRQEGTFFAALSFSSKSTYGLGAVIAGLGLEFIDWPTGPQIQTTADIPSGTIIELGILAGPFIGFLGFLSIWFFTQYRLTPIQHKEILKKIEARGGACENKTKEF
ncbi:MAG: MFS transporter [Candidatus Azotimanducaceae bacterium]|uniref:MFS transporter n=1 Tax=OM182 bacterium TaxID=2510334 RepID=A0A520S5N9_9GAMM|nr:hypothetical protein [Gammaproteobacteria bacterium]OUV68447.1 MAG: hypothetical protein CBC93_01815 [Gammaproteobacteria bacterium TMED133]RZO77803.1 MAG: hypothetical protein EVA68_00840 [OM182 bacterium]